MDDKTAALIEKLADKLGTTAEHLWGVLLRQAPINALVDLFINAAMVVTAVYLTRLVIRKITVPLLSRDEYMARPAWNGDMAWLAGAMLTVWWIVTLLRMFNTMTGTVTAFFNPEFWALSYILSNIQ